MRRLLLGDVGTGKTAVALAAAAQCVAAGYQVAAYGQAGRNGVAVLSRTQLADVARGFAGDPAPEQARVLSVTAGGVPLYTDARHYAAAGVPVVLYGAGPRSIEEANAHRADERLPLGDLHKATEVVAMTLALSLAVFRPFLPESFAAAHGVA